MDKDTNITYNFAMVDTMRFRFSYKIVTWIIRKKFDVNMHNYMLYIIIKANLEDQRCSIEVKAK